MAIDAVFNLSATYADPTELIFNETLTQVEGVGGEAPPDYQVQTQFQYPATLSGGVFISRFKSNYNGTDGKTEIENGDVGNWPLQDPVADLGGSGSLTRESAQNLVAGTAYVGLHFWISSYYYDKVFVQQTHFLSAAISDTDAVGGAHVWPAGNALVVTNVLTVSGNTTPATDISLSRASVTEGAAAGSVVGTAFANRINGAFAAGTPSVSWIEVAANGRLTVAAGQTAPAPGSYPLQIVYDNSAIQGGGVYAETFDIVVSTVVIGGTAKFIEIPAINTNNNVAFSSLSALEDALAALASDWNATMTNWGLQVSTEPVLGLAAGQHGNINWSGHGPFPKRVTVRGMGPFSQDGYAPTAGTKFGRVIWDNCKDLRLMGIEAQPASISSGYNTESHKVVNCDRVEWVRNAILGDVARTMSGLATTPKAGTQVLIWIDKTYDSKFMQNVLMGSRECVIGKSPNVRADRIEFRGNVMAQNHNDLIKFGTSICDDWIVADNLAMGKGRNSGGQHRDFIQILGTNGTGYARNWLIEGNWVQSRTSWGADTYLAKQAFYWGGNAAASAATILDNFIGSPGKGIQTFHAGATIKFNTFFIPIDTLATESSGTSWTANYTGIRPAGGMTTDENIVCGTGVPEGAGPNGIAISSSGFVASDNPFGTFNWDEMGQYLENYDGTYTTNVKTQVSPREEGGVEQYIPKAGTRAHWGHADPTGCFQLFKRVFDASEHDHWKDWGWPCAPAAHLYYDTTNAMGGATGTYQNFDGDGNYLG